MVEALKKMEIKREDTNASARGPSGAEPKLERGDSPLGNERQLVKRGMRRPVSRFDYKTNKFCFFKSVDARRRCKLVFIVVEIFCFLEAVIVEMLVIEKIRNRKTRQ